MLQAENFRWTKISEKKKFNLNSDHFQPTANVIIMNSEHVSLAKGIGNIELPFKCTGNGKWQASDGAEYTKLFCIVRIPEVMAGVVTNQVICTFFVGLLRLLLLLTARIIVSFIASLANKIRNSKGVLSDAVFNNKWSHSFFHYLVYRCAIYAFKISLDCISLYWPS